MYNDVRSIGLEDGGGRDSGAETRTRTKSFLCPFPTLYDLVDYYFQCLSRTLFNVKYVTIYIRCVLTGDRCNALGYIMCSALQIPTKRLSTRAHANIKYSSILFTYGFSSVIIS